MEKTFKSNSFSGEKEIILLSDGRIATSGCMNYPDCYGFIRVYNPDGEIEAWVKIHKSDTESSAKTTCGYYLAADSTGAIYHVGVTQASLYDSAKGNSDGFLAKITL